MYVCICHNITDRDIKEVLQQNQSMSSTELCEKLGLGSDCGVCVQQALQLLDTSSSILPKSRPNLKPGKSKA